MWPLRNTWPLCAAHQRHKDWLAAPWSKQLHSCYTHCLAKGKENNWRESTGFKTVGLFWKHFSIAKPFLFILVGSFSALGNKNIISVWPLRLARIRFSFCDQLNYKLHRWSEMSPSGFANMCKQTVRHWDGHVHIYMYLKHVIQFMPAKSKQNKFIRIALQHEERNEDKKNLVCVCGGVGAWKKNRIFKYSLVWASYSRVHETWLRRYFTSLLRTSRREAAKWREKSQLSR